MTVAVSPVERFGRIRVLKVGPARRSEVYFEPGNRLALVGVDPPSVGDEIDEMEPPAGTSARVRTLEKCHEPRARVLHLDPHDLLVDVDTHFHAVGRGQPGVADAVGDQFAHKEHDV